MSEIAHSGPESPESEWSMIERLGREPWDDETWFAVRLLRRLYEIVDDPSRRNLWRFEPKANGEMHILTNTLSPTSATDGFTRDKPTVEINFLRRQLLFGEVRQWKRSRSEDEAYRRQWIPRYVKPPTPPVKDRRCRAHIIEPHPQEDELKALGIFDRWAHVYEEQRRENRRRLDLENYRRLHNLPQSPSLFAPLPYSRSPTLPWGFHFMAKRAKKTAASPRQTRSRTRARKDLEHSEAAPTSVNETGTRADSSGAEVSPTSLGGRTTIPLRRSERIKKMARRKAASGGENKLHSNKKAGAPRSRRRR
ncbi:MAG: hypothetical protein M1816_005010 [Peltula sp. TS41687]|nr:MAG: hypothetical protein M1816_005010 [Peltula sp. TS41687]